MVLEAVIWMKEWILNLFQTDPPRSEEERKRLVRKYRELDEQEEQLWDQYLTIGE